jgi:hypothetical protein
LYIQGGRDAHPTRLGFFLTYNLNAEQLSEKFSYKTRFLVTRASVLNWGRSPLNPENTRCSGLSPVFAKLYQKKLESFA